MGTALIDTWPRTTMAVSRGLTAFKMAFLHGQADLLCSGVAPISTATAPETMAGAGGELRSSQGMTMAHRPGPGTAPEDVLLRYDTVTIVLHWATAVLVVVLWVLGQTSDWWPRGPIRSTSSSLHIVLGFALAAVLVTRVVWCIGPGRALPAANDGILRLLSRTTHLALYVLLLVTVGLGIANALVRGSTLFGVVSLPQIGDRELRHPITHWHGIAASTVMTVAAFHAAAGLLHHYVWKDRVLQRMWRAS
jgi:cytochrome b561